MVRKVTQQMLDAGIQLGGAHGQCRLKYTDATTLTLHRLNGSSLLIDGITQTIPEAGVTLANTGLSASTLYYIYAYMNGSVMSLEASVTGHSTHADGVEIQTGDSSRSLVGMVYTDGSTPGQFQSEVLTLSWFNRRLKKGVSDTNHGQYESSSTTYIEIYTGSRVPFLCWADTSPFGFLFIGTRNSSTSASTRVKPGIDGAAVKDYSVTRAPVNVHEIMTPTMYYASEGELSEGYHQLELWGSVNSGIGYWDTKLLTMYVEG